ncbi:MAG: type III toxin-antitoxin system ToxN/AbiQ family toxin [Clostridium sp.]|nr:type III toxin-antitoxin system ToxN/AbiQ family toxin [Clostridium sp.]
MRKQRRLKLYYISNDYIDYLRKFDDKVRFNKNHSRPYVGIVYTYNNNNYFAPLSSPKPKYQKMKKTAIDIWLIDEGNLEVINFNNMIPCPIEELTELLPTVKEEKYKKLLENQISSINKDRELLLKKITRFHQQYNKKTLYENVLLRCCNFRLLEIKCMEYINLVVN